MNTLLFFVILGSIFSQIGASSANFRRQRFLKHHARGQKQKRSNPSPVKTQNDFDRLSWKINYYRKMQEKLGRHDAHLIKHHFEKYIVNGIMS